MANNLTLSENQVLSMLSGYSKELSASDGLGDKRRVQIKWAKRITGAMSSCATDLVDDLDFDINKKIKSLRSQSNRARSSEIKEACASGIEALEWVKTLLFKQPLKLNRSQRGRST